MASRDTEALIAAIGALRQAKAGQAAKKQQELQNMLLLAKLNDAMKGNEMNELQKQLLDQREIKFTEERKKFLQDQAIMKIDQAERLFGKDKETGRVNLPEHMKEEITPTLFPGSAYGYTGREAKASGKDKRWYHSWTPWREKEPEMGVITEDRAAYNEAMSSEGSDKSKEILKILKSKGMINESGGFQLK